MASRSIRVLIVDDEPQIVRTLRAGLRAGGYSVLSASDGEGALNAIASESPDLMILDLAMSPMDGFEVVRRVRERSAMPIIVLSVRESDRDKVEALDLGADDYLVKPFSLDELLARIRVALRHAERGANHAPPAFESGPLRIDWEARVVIRHGEEVKLTPKEFDLLKALVDSAGKVLTHRSLLQKVWGPEYGDEAEYLHVYIGHLR
ncbi:MAG: response regulator transcription factor, partial [Chloroflexi bacterium]|nr:response regulator transcription factor [Chloroflexota bacterium]